MLHIFDLDGTLVDTRVAVEESYRQAGATMPPSAWGKPWHEWTTEEVHKKKIELYPTVLEEYLEVFPYAYVARDLAPNAFILTSASQEAVRAVLECIGMKIPLLGNSLSIDKKIERLNALDRECTYFDDDRNNVARIRMECPKVQCVWVQTRLQCLM